MVVPRDPSPDLLVGRGGHRGVVVCSRFEEDADAVPLRKRGDQTKQSDTKKWLD
jgi:hypothetical protein